MPMPLPPPCNETIWACLKMWKPKIELYWCVIKLGMNQTVLYITILVPYVVWMNIPITSPIYDIIGCNRYTPMYNQMYNQVCYHPFYRHIGGTSIYVLLPPQEWCPPGSQGVDPGPNRAPPRSARSGGIWTWRRAFVGPASRWIHRPNKGHKNP